MGSPKRTLRVRGRTYQWEKPRSATPRMYRLVQTTPRVNCANRVMVNLTDRTIVVWEEKDDWVERVRYDEGTSIEEALTMAEQFVVLGMDTGDG